MILYSLTCDVGHRFESWFRDSVAYEDQLGRGLLLCPVCRSAQVFKAIMAPSVMGTRPSTAAQETAQETRDVVVADEKSRELRALVRGFRDRILAEGCDVGGRFAAEARRIHEGEAPQRQIYGQATVADARDLIADGVPVLPMPIMPDELN